MFDQDATDATFDELRHEGADVYDKIFDGCTFRRCHLEQVTFHGCRFSDCHFEACDLIGVRFRDCGLADVRFQGGRAMGIDWVEVRKLTLRLGFDGVRLDYSDFSGLPLSGTVFRACSLRDVVFSGADLRRATFPESELGGARFDRADLRGTDLRDAQGVLFDPREVKLQRTQVSAGTALGLLDVLGVQSPDLDALIG